MFNRWVGTARGWSGTKFRFMSLELWHLEWGQPSAPSLTMHRLTPSAVRRSIVCSGEASPKSTVRHRMSLTLNPSMYTWLGSCFWRSGFRPVAKAQGRKILYRRQSANALRLQPRCSITGYDLAQVESLIDATRKTISIRCAKLVLSG